MMEPPTQQADTRTASDQAGDAPNAWTHRLLTGESCVFMLDSGGPYVASPSLDIDALFDTFRRERYAVAEAHKEDYCTLWESDFVDWLIQAKHLIEIPVRHVAIEHLSGRAPAYVPSHWPACPACAVGRGEPTVLSETHRPSLNRVTVARACTNCKNTWDHVDEPMDSRKPMLDDDGRYVAGGCVPYAVSKVAGMSFQFVSEFLAARGWTTSDGMNEDRAVAAAHELGLRLTPGRVLRSDSITLRQFLDSASPTKRYIVSTHDHWLAVVEGRNLDQSGTHGRRLVRAFWEVDASGARER